MSGNEATETLILFLSDKYEVIHNNSHLSLSAFETEDHKSAVISINYLQISYKEERFSQTKNAINTTLTVKYGKKQIIGGSGGTTFFLVVEKNG